MRVYLSRDVDAGANLDTSRDCGRMVGIGNGIGGAGMTRLKGLRTSKSPGVPASAARTASAASVAFVA